MRFAIRTYHQQVLQYAVRHDWKIQIWPSGHLLLQQILELEAETDACGQKWNFYIKALEAAAFYLIIKIYHRCPWDLWPSAGEWRKIYAALPASNAKDPSKISPFQFAWTEANILISILSVYVQRGRDFVKSILGLLNLQGVD